ncbi:MAG: amidohydrolase family protein [Leptospiraceae bacterium]|nr:amidohydrolase family protein [Leptospiraceae bacterium]MDW8306749.1 amidohydrolase family protein [Leptospiraceae bacterium]
MQIFRLYKGQWGLLPDGSFRRDPWYLVAGREILESGFGQPPKGFPRKNLPEGVVLPGFVNAHTHLELSYLVGKIPRALGLRGFISQVVAHREGVSLSQKVAAAAHMVHQAFLRGTFFFNDIANDSQFTMALLGLPYFRGNRFFEILGFSHPHDKRRIEEAQELMARDPFVFPTIHSPYGSSPAVLRFVREKARRTTLSMHLLEAPEEYLLPYEIGSAYEILTSLGQYVRHREIYQVPLLEYLSQMGMLSFKKLILVHLLHARWHDILYLQDHVPHAAWVLCHRSNIYLGYERKNFETLLKSPLTLLIGTDSPASSPDVSVIDELYALGALQLCKESQLMRAATFAAYEFFEIPLRSVPHFLFKGARPEISSLAMCREIELLEC